ncbi:MAG TPA: hypothetical protein VMH24_00960 [Candidatus Sulfotelmatobacter sp.]|nr:hypothetical protein [Candidatus Sulfotelmatobacter sp.]
MATRSSLLGAARHTPALWTVGLVGFLARGGWLVILLPMLALPSPVSLSVLIGPDLVDANGLSARVATLLAVAGVIALVAVFAGLVTATLADIATFQGLLDAVGVPARPLTGPGMRGLALQLLMLQLLAAGPLLIAAGLAISAIVVATRAEILLPSDQSLPLLWRIAEVTWPALLAVAATALLAGHLYTVLGRELMARRAGLAAAAHPGPRGALRDTAAALVRRPARAVGGTLAGWVAGLASVLVAAGCVAVGWTVAEALILSPTTATSPLGSVATWIAAAGGTVALAASFGLALVILGATAALRSALLTQASLGPRRAA